jgi:hypothetical protein
MISNIDMNNYTLTNFTFPSSNLTGSNSIPVNIGSLNYLKKSNWT